MDRTQLRQILRVARFQGWTVDRLEDEIMDLAEKGVDVQTAPPDQ